MTTTYRGCIAYNQALVAAFDESSGELFELTPDRAEQLRPACVGFSWGHTGAGTHCLALSLLLDCTNDPHLSLDLYREFAATFIVCLPIGQRWELSSDAIQTWVGIQSARLEGVA